MQKPVAVLGEGQEADPLDGARRQYQKNLKYIDMHQFFLVLGQYITGGRYEQVLNAERDVDLSEYRLICFDLAKVQADPDLYPVVAMLITELSLDLFRKFPDAVKYIALDEAWTMLSGVLSEFIESHVPYHSQNQRLGNDHHPGHLRNHQQQDWPGHHQ